MNISSLEGKQFFLIQGDNKSNFSCRETKLYFFKSLYILFMQSVARNYKIYINIYIFFIYIFIIIYYIINIRLLMGQLNFIFL